MASVTPRVNQHGEVTSYVQPIRFHVGDKVLVPPSDWVHDVKAVWLEEFIVGGWQEVVELSGGPEVDFSIRAAHVVMADG